MASGKYVSLIPRQVHVWMRPRPRSIADSQLVLRELQRFGEVATFYNMKVLSDFPSTQLKYLKAGY
jgi:hypothetical protein